MNVCLQLSESELRTINNALNEICNIDHIQDWEFQTRMGVDREEARRVLDKVHASLQENRGARPADSIVHAELVEIYSDATNAAVMRHPGRKFPGVLVQGDTLHSMCQTADSACAAGKQKLSPEQFLELNQLRNHLQSLLSHFKAVLGEHGVPLPFSDRP
jgi:hypothetical protein